MFKLIKRRVATEKATLLLEQKGQYTYDVDLRLNKTQIKKLFKHIYGVQITSIHTYILPLKKKRSRLQCGYEPRFKRVIFTIKQVNMLGWEKEKVEKAAKAKAEAEAKANGETGTTLNKL